MIIATENERREAVLRSNNIQSHVAKLEQILERKRNPNSPIFVRQIKVDLWEVFNPESTGRVKIMTTKELEQRPRDHGYLFLNADGGIYFEEPE